MNIQISSMAVVCIVLSVLAARSAAQRPRSGGNFLNRFGGSFLNRFAVLGDGACPVVSTPSDFNLTSYLGRWYELERFAHWFELGVKCGRAEYGLNNDGSISVTNAGERDGLFRRRRRAVTITGSATTPNATRPAELRVSFSDFDRSGSDEANYFLVDTDYVSYAVVFSCSQPSFLFGRNIQYAWILTRDQGVSPSNLDALKAELATSGIDVSNFKPVEQQDCQLPVATEA